jgi:hypothetical protein
VILIGRDYDCKYVVSRSWSAFLATLADDMHTDKWFIDEDTLELKLRAFKQQGVEPAYIDILRWRSDQKFGRRMPPKRPPIRANSSPSLMQNGFNYSPYGSPTKEDPRGRSPSRLTNANGKAPAASSSSSHHAPSPRGGGMLVGSPLARVAEESSSSSMTPSSQPLTVNTAFANGEGTVNGGGEQLISGIDTPASAMVGKGEGEVGGEGMNGSLVEKKKSRLGSSTVLASGDDVEVVPGGGGALSPETKAGAVDGREEGGLGLTDVGLEGEMRDVKI